MQRIVRATLTSALMSICCIATAADGDDALFGLKWGMTVAQVKAAGVDITKPLKDDRNFQIHKVTTVPRGLSGFESYSLLFADGKLVKLWALSENIKDDILGREGKERFEALRAALTEKYGKATTDYQKVGATLFKERDEFYQCLAYTGCGLWAATFESPEKDIVLSLKGLRRGAGYLDLTAEAKPQWKVALEIYKGNRTKSDKDAL